LWGATWSPAIINSPGMGLMFKIKNLQNTQQTAGVDFVQMTIYYTTPTGTYNVTSSPSDVKWIYSDNEIRADLNLSSSSACSGSLYDLTGKLIQSKNYGTLDAGINQVKLYTEILPEGIYFWQLSVGDRLFTRKIIVTKN
ncbi:MAG TPA: T9SS type A sorting domain-containing protein, partial [Bacteroidia bacterium]|nr:T9SS type A sorting domain-containing protein [Bacteroidia bacterium]